MRTALPSLPAAEPRPLAAPRSDDRHPGGYPGTPLSRPKAPREVTDHRTTVSAQNEQKQLNQPVY
jgi:hypothetical protein